MRGLVGVYERFLIWLAFQIRKHHIPNDDELLPGLQVNDTFADFLHQIDDIVTSWQLLSFIQEVRLSEIQKIAENLTAAELIPNKFNHVERVLQSGNRDFNKMFSKVVRLVQEFKDDSSVYSRDLFVAMRFCLQEVIHGRMTEYFHIARRMTGHDFFVGCDIYITNKQTAFGEFPDLEATIRDQRNSRSGHTAWAKQKIDERIQKYHDLDRQRGEGSAERHWFVIQTLIRALEALGVDPEE